MGGVCSAGIKKGSEEYGDNKLGFSGKIKGVMSIRKKKGDDEYPDVRVYDEIEQGSSYYDSGELRFSGEFKNSTPARTPITKEPHVSSFLGKASIAGLEKAVDVLDTLGSSMSGLNPGSGFVYNMASRGNKINMLAFEVANTIAKGASLLQSLSEENVQILKKEILTSEGVQQLVSTDMKELLSIAAVDKREEFDAFSREVSRFGDLCKDPQWHNLSRFFSRLESDPANHKREDAEMTMQVLTTLAHHTSELYHELNSLDRYDQDYRRKVEEVESLQLPRKGESLTILQSERKQQRKLVRSLRKKSLWSRSLEEVVEKLVDIVTFINEEILEAFGHNGSTLVGKERTKKPERLGVAGLSLHYANIITQIDNIASRPTCLPPNTRDTLYNGLPCSVKTALRSRLQTVGEKEGLRIPQIKAEMEKTLRWLIPMATDTTKAHQGFGWIGEWANTSIEYGNNTTINNSIIRIQTLHHADKQKMDGYILELVTWLHRLISRVRYGDSLSKTRSQNQNGTVSHVGMRGPPSPTNDYKIRGTRISSDDKRLLEEVTKRRRVVLGTSKSQEFTRTKKGGMKVWPLSKSTGSSPVRDMDQKKTSNLDKFDGLDTTFEIS